MNITSKWMKRSLKIAIIVSLNIGFTGTIYAYSDAMIYSPAGKPMFEVVFADTGQMYRPQEWSTYNLSTSNKAAIGDGLQYWAEILGSQSQNNNPIQVLVGSMDEANANSNAHTNTFGRGHRYLAQAIQGTVDLEWINLRDLETERTKPTSGAFANISIGKYLGADKAGCENGWYIDALTPIPEGEQATNLVGSIRHEMGHSLGIASYMAYDKETDGHYLKLSAANENSWNAHLTDQNGNYAKPDMRIVTSADFEQIQKANPDAKPEDYFILDRGNSAYFVGEHVSAVLNGATFDERNALPVLGWEGGSLSLSHLQTTGMMSHLSYSNYTNFMEVELAVMQDLGYQIDRKNFFGYSVYDDGQTIVNTNGYSARNAEGTAYIPDQYNTATLGVGLHVYGKNNNITQAADIWTVGSGAVGMRIDGNANTIKLNKANVVHADGYRGIGVLVAYGSGHELTQDGAVTADGAGGVGVRFDFGSSSNGAVDEYRGSYIRYIRALQYNPDGSSTGKVVWGGNIPLGEWDEQPPATPKLDGALVNNYNLNGYLSGSEQAILIGKNAFVENINVCNGAFIRGDITSEWKHFQTTEGVYDDDIEKKSLKLRYQGLLYEYDDYIADLVTNLNFNADIAYDGNINGSDNMLLNVGTKELNYSGSADIISVSVDEGAALYGGNYIVNRQRIKNTEVDFSGQPISTGVAEYAANTGDFISKGTIGALNQNGQIVDMQITAKANALDSGNIKSRNSGSIGNTGSFSAEGGIRFTAQNEQIGQIKITGFDANNVQLGSNLQLSFDRNGTYLPGHTYSAGQIVYVDGAAQNITFGSADNYQTGLLDAAYNNGNIAFNVVDNLGARDNKQQTMLNAVESIRSSRSALNAAYAPLYNLSATQAKRSLTDIYGGLQLDLATAAQQDRYLTETVYSRLRDPQSGNGQIWVNMQKGWDSWGTDQVKDQTMYAAVGIDRQAGNRWTWGGC